MSDPVPPAYPKNQRRPLLLLALSIPLVVASCLSLRPPEPLADRSLAPRSALALDLSRPDALIESEALGSLPKDLLQMPLLRDTLTEDLVFYYQGNADRLGITGALRRIAFEHQLNLRDDLISDLLDQPAEVALWRSEDGKLKHALLSIRRGALARLLQPLASMVTADNQLSKVGELHVKGAAAPVYRLRYNVDRAIVFVAHDDRLLVLSSAQMLQSTEAADSELGEAEVLQLEQLLSGRSPYPARFNLSKRKSRHRISLSAEYLALGYGQFIPQLAGIRFEQQRSGWSGWMALNPVATSDLDFRPLWSAMPMGASACAAVPVSSAALQPLFERLSESELLAPELAARLGGPAALCWYGKSRLHSPLLVSRLAPADSSEGLDTQLGQLFAGMVGAYEGKVEGGRFAVEETQEAGFHSWQRVVGSSYGLYPAEDFEQADALSNSHFFRVTLARHGEVLLFSLDDSLVEQALATLDQRFPPLAEQLPKGRQVPLYLAADSFATLLETETLESLPSESESVFRNAAEAWLLPRLRKLGTHQRFALALPERLNRINKDFSWVPLTWSAL